MKIKHKNSNIYSVKGKTVAIIGACGLLGQQYVKYLSDLGANIIIGDLDFKKCKDLSDSMNSYGGKTTPLEINILSEKSIVAFFKKINSTFKKLDILINNAIVKPDGYYDSFINYKKETLMEVLDGNLTGVSLSCREAIKYFLKNKKGIIVNISSIYGVVAPDQRIYENSKNIYTLDEALSLPVSYAISKAGIIQLTKYLASYYREKNIRINCLSPGGVFSEHDSIFKKKYSEKTLIGRMANKEDYNGAIHFLCSDASKYMNGFNLVVDGGWTAI